MIKTCIADYVRNLHFNLYCVQFFLIFFLSIFVTFIQTNYLIKRVNCTCKQSSGSIWEMCIFSQRKFCTQPQPIMKSHVSPTASLSMTKHSTSYSSFLAPFFLSCCANLPIIVPLSKLKGLFVPIYYFCWKK